MNSKDRYTIENKKKKKTPTITGKSAQTTQTSLAYVSYIGKPEIEKVDRTQKSARTIKNDTNSKLLKTERSFKVLNNTTNKSVSYVDNYSIRPKTTTHATKTTKENHDILADIEVRYGFRENLDPNHINKRWSDLPTRTSDLTFGSNLSTLSYISSRQRIENTTPTLDESPMGTGAKNSKIHNRNYSFTKAQALHEVQKPSLTSKIAASKIQNHNKNSKSTYQRNETSLNNTAHSLATHEPIYEENSPYDLNPQRPRSLLDVNRPNVIKQKNQDYFDVSIEHMISDRPASRRVSDNMFIEETHITVPRYTPKENPKETQRIVPEEHTANYSYVPEPKNLISQNSNLNYNSAPASNNSSKSGQTPNYNSNHSSNNKSFNNIQENPGKKSTGKSTNANSNNSSYIKTKGSFGKSAYTQKTESTCISGGDSPSPILDCDETLSTNFAALLNNKNENNCGFWVEKFDPEEGKGTELYNNSNQRGILQDITEVIMKVDELTTEEELANFNPDSNACAIDSETINYLVMREIDYSPDPHYFDKKQMHITWMMRAILLDWMMEVCMEFTLKRETFHYAVNYVDRYLSAVPNVQKWELQLVGVTAMYIASKVEEIYAPKVSDFARSADNGYTTDQIMDMELKMLKALKWLLNPPTLNTWANWYMSQWDLYIENSPYAQNHPLLQECEERIQFKQPTEKSYARFREIMQLIDCSCIEVQTLQYKPRTLIASFLYLVLGKHFKQFTIDQIYEEFPKSSLYLLDQEYAFNDLFGDFLLYSFGFQLIDLLPSIQYASTFFKLPLNYDLPTAAKINKENVLEGHFEEFLAYQTHHPLNVDYVRKRPRNLF